MFNVVLNFGLENFIPTGNGKP